jgi:IS5 family transposase
MKNRRQPSRPRASQRKSTGQKVRYRVSNWPDYNESLVQRGSITLWINTEDLGAWKPEDYPKRGGQRQYSDGAIQCLLMVRGFFRLTLRATEGFVKSVFQLMDLELGVPDYTTICRRAKFLEVVLPRQAKGPLHAVLDSTGLKVFGEGEWKVRQHGYSKRRTWRKLHLSVDSGSQEIQAVVLSEAGQDDAGVVPELLDQMEEPVAQLSGDGAYDQRKVYQACRERGITRVTIPPRKNARIWQHGNWLEPPLARDANLRQIRKRGRKRWKQESGYHQRSLAETAMFRFKTLFGPDLRSRRMPQQQTEAKVKCAALNRITHLGMPASYRVA